MPSQYEAQTPSLLPSGIRPFFEEFYRVSDTPGEYAHVEYAKRFFTREACLVMGVKRVEGTDEIVKLRRGMWEHVSERSHRPSKIFSFPPRSQEEGKEEEEVMIYGDVGYVFKDGRKAEVEWAARAKLVYNGEGWKMAFYQVYLDSAALQSAK